MRASNFGQAQYRQSVRDQTLRHRPQSSIYADAYHNARVNAVVQDAFLGRGTNSPYLAIMNHMGLRCDSAAPTTVPDELIQIIGPSPRIRRLQTELDEMRVLLHEKYSRPSRATGSDRCRYQSKRNELRTVKQTQYRKNFDMIRREYFQNNARPAPTCAVLDQCPPVQRDLLGRRRIVDILGDLDKEVSNSDVVKRKIEAINAWIAYAFVCEPRTKRTKHSPQPLMTLTQANEVPRQPPPEKAALPPLNTTDPPPVPPPPYTEADSTRWRNSSKLTLKIVLPAKKKPKPVPPPCTFCGKEYKRTASMWDHVETHLRHSPGGRVPCPVVECKSSTVVCESISKFKAHAYQVHGIALRPKIVLVSATNSSKRD